MRISPRGMNIQNMQGNPQWPPKERCKKGEPEGQMSPEGARDQPPSRGWGGRASGGAERGGNAIIRKKNVQSMHKMSSVVGKMLIK
jgi:hypothetical protein